MKRNVVFSVITAITGGALVGVLLLYFRPVTAPVVDQAVSAPVGYADGKMQWEGGSVFVSVAETAAEREQGLSGVPVMPENAGKPFLFPDAGRPGFWMKDMQFALDIVWLSSDWNIVDVSPHLTPDTYPIVFSPRADAQYVLEVNAGFVARHHLSIGESLSFEK